MLLAYSSGLLAAISPCVIVLVPLLLFRFLREPSPGEGSQLVRLGYFAFGFQGSYLLFGYLLSAILTSSIQNGFKLGLGGLFFNVCLLATTGRLDPLSMPMFENTFAMGVSVALLMSFNPCTAPFLAVIISLSTHDALVSLFFFGNGLLTPSLLCVLLGKGFIKSIGRQSAPVMHKLNQFMSFLLGASGLYLVHTIAILKGKADLWTALVFLWGSCLFVLRGYSLHDLNWSKEFSSLQLSLARSGCCPRITPVNVNSSSSSRFSFPKVCLTLILMTVMIMYGCAGESHNPNSHVAVEVMEAMMNKNQSKTTSSSSSVVSSSSNSGDAEHEKARQDKRRLVIERMKKRAIVSENTNDNREFSASEIEAVDVGVIVNDEEEQREEKLPILSGSQNSTNNYNNNNDRKGHVDSTHSDKVDDAQQIILPTSVLKPHNGNAHEANDNNKETTTVVVTEQVTKDHHLEIEKIEVHTDNSSSSSFVIPVGSTAGNTVIAHIEAGAGSVKTEIVTNHDINQVNGLTNISTVSTSADNITVDALVLATKKSDKGDKEELDKENVGAAANTHTDTTDKSASKAEEDKKVIIQEKGLLSELQKRKERIFAKMKREDSSATRGGRKLLGAEEGDDMLCIEIEPCAQCDRCMRLYMLLSMMWGISCYVVATWLPEHTSEGDKLV